MGTNLYSEHPVEDQAGKNNVSVEGQFAHVEMKRMNQHGKFNLINYNTQIKAAITQHSLTTTTKKRSENLH